MNEGDGEAGTEDDEKGKEGKVEKWNPVFSGFRVAFHLPGMTILYSRNCQTLKVPRHIRRFTYFN